MNATPRVWRLILDGARDGAMNMALDRAVQEARESGLVPATLRLYEWSRPTVTLGRFQKTSSVDLDACDRFGVDVVRRATGGRGVLHDDELTYSVVAGVEDGIARGVAASYALLSGALADAYQRLGVDAALTQRDSAATASGACYLQTTRADLSLGATKLSGSAQVWLGSTVLQHGSFTVSRDLHREAAVFRLTGEQSALLAAKTTVLADVLAKVPDRSDIATAVRSAFEHEFGVIFTESGFTETELARADELVESAAVQALRD